MDGAQAGDRCPTTDVIMSQCVGGRGGCDAAFGVSLSESASGADLGGSSKYSNENFEGLKWRRVPCEQQLDMG